MDFKMVFGGPILAIGAIATLITGEINVRHFADITRADDPIQYWFALAFMIAAAAWFTYEGYFNKSN